VAEGNEVKGKINAGLEAGLQKSHYRASKTIEKIKRDANTSCCLGGM
jgi:hypothetical protein